MGSEQLPDWVRVFRTGFAPQLSTAGLVALRDALERDDVRLRQGCTTSPPPLQCQLDWPVEGACPLGIAAWLGDGLETIGDVEEFFAAACFKADESLGEPCACRGLLNWIDDTPRDEMRRLLLAEVERALSTRLAVAAAMEREGVV